MVDGARYVGKKKYKRSKRSSEKSKIDPALYGTPVEEVDPFIFEDTFCVIGKKYGNHYVYRFSAEKSLFIFSPFNPIRKFACRIITNQLFDIFIILVIMCNCITLALLTNNEDTKTGKILVDKDLDKVFEHLENIFLAVYSLEMTLKIVARGFGFHKFSYIRNSWNVLDFIVVVSSAFSIILVNVSSSNPDLEFFRSLRVLRAIKTFSIVPGLRMMINALLSSVVQLLEVMALTLFCLMLFALLALELFMGKLKQKCVLVKNGTRHIQMVYEEGSRSKEELEPINPNDPDKNLFWYEWASNQLNWLMRKDGYPKEEYQPCGNETWSRRCPTGYECLENIGENYDDGWTNFDNFFSSMLVTFQLITLDFWERIYDLVLSHTTPWSVVFFIIVIFFGSFYLLNLMLAVVAMSYEQEYHQSIQVPLSLAQKLSSMRKASTFSLDDPLGLNITALTHIKKRTPTEREMVIRAIKHYSGGSSRIVIDERLEENVKNKRDLPQAIMTLLARRRSVASYTEEDTLSVHYSRGGSVVTYAPKRSAISTTINGEPSKSKQTIAPIITIEAPPEDNISATSIRLRLHPSLDSQQSRNPSFNESGKSKALSDCWCLLLLRNKLKPIVSHQGFETTITTIIIFNTIFLACEHHEQPNWLSSILEVGDLFFTAAFAIEAIVKILALQKEYFRSFGTLFDLFLVATSILDLSLEHWNLSFMRTMRLLRIFKLAQSWVTMKVLLNIIYSSFAALGYLTLILLIVLYIFAVLGMQIIGGYYTRKAFHAEHDEDEFPRWNFQNMIHAFMMVFRVICGEWIEPLWDCLLVTSPQKKVYKCFLIFLPILVVGNFIVLNLFLALLLNSFDTEELAAKRQEELESSGKADNLKKIVEMLIAKKQQTDLTGEDSSSSETSMILSNNEPKLTQELRKRTRKGINRFRKAVKRVILLNRKALVARRVRKAILKAKIKRVPSIRLLATNANDDKKNQSTSRAAITANHEESKEVEDPSPCMPKKCWTTNCKLFNRFRRMNWGAWDRQRLFATRVVLHPVFEWLILALIFASSITLCFEDAYLDEKKELKEALFYINNIFTIIFLVEMLFKWFALGLWSYFTNSWTILDAFIVAVSVISGYFEVQNRYTGHTKHSNHNFAALKALRTLRALRPLRAISRWGGMKIIVNALVIAIPSIINVLLVCLVFWLFFAIMGVNTFKGRFYRCVESESGEIVSTFEVRTKADCCKNTQYSWINHYPNFDNVLQAYLTLFQVATFEGWMEAMQASVDSRGINEQPSRDNAVYFYFFFVLFIVFGSFFTLNLFIGVIIDNFNRLKKKYEGHLLEALLTPSQRYYYSTLKKLERKRPRKVIRRPVNNFFALCYDVSLSRKFELGIFVMIFLNMIIMGFEHHNQREMLTHILSGCNSLFTTVYSLEAIIKIIGLRQYYFSIPWNLFDFSLVIASIFDLGVGNIVGDALPIPPIMLRVVRVVRIGRVLRLIKAAKGIRRLLFALIVSSPALFNIGALLSLITFIYAILGMALFGRIARNTAIDEQFNFETFMRSCLLLLRLMTAAGWNDVLNAMITVKPVCGTYRKIACGQAGEGECANTLFAILYLVSYLFISFLIVINMYIAIILENFYEATREEDLGFVEDDLELFYHRWSRYDPQATQFIPFDHLSDFLDSMDPPVGVRKPNMVAIVAFNLPIARGNKIHCLDILHALVKSSLGQIDDSEYFRKLQDQMDQKFRKIFPTRKLLDIVSSTRQWKMQHNAAITIQRAWRAYFRRHAPQETKSTVTSSRQAPRSSLKDHNGFLSKMGNLFGVHHGGKRLSSNDQSPIVSVKPKKSKKSSGNIRKDSRQSERKLSSPNESKNRRNSSSNSSSKKEEESARRASQLVVSRSGTRKSRSFS